MKFTLAWLKDHLDTEASLTEIVDTLTRIGLEVEHVDNPADRLKPFVIAEILEAKQHPNADRLRVCMVNDGSGAPVQVVCGAPNARTGLKSVFSPVGTYIPAKKITLSKGVIRGVESNGMLCSAAELELPNDHDGIIELPADAPVGTGYAQWAHLDAPVIEINLTPNRPDATSIHGIARDLAAAGLGTLKNGSVAPIAGTYPCPVSVTLELNEADAHLAPVFALRLVRGVRNGPSPDWLHKRLEEIGLRPINALVDITNFITFDRGRPLHVFDAKKVKGNIVVRRAKSFIWRFDELRELSDTEAKAFELQGHPVEQIGDGIYRVGFPDPEKILALDGKEYFLDPNDVVIADEAGVESIAGIMGGEHSGCDETTTDVLIESALWDPINIAQSGRKLGIITDARYRFERGIDPAFTMPGLDLATKMVIDLCGGEASHPVVAGKVPEPSRSIDFPWSEVKRLTGVSLDVATMRQSLETLGFKLTALAGTAQRVSVLVPSWRPDVEGKADLVEEIIRLAGLDRITSTPMLREEATIAKPVLTLLQKRTRNARRALASQGLVEAVTWSFISKDAATTFGGGSPALALANPIASDLSDMRPSLLPGLIMAAQRNADRGQGDLALFEVGQVFKGDGETDQRQQAAAIRRGTAKVAGTGRHWSGAAKSVDVFDAKADLIALLASLGVPLAGLQIGNNAPGWYHPGRSGTLQFGPQNVIAAFGEFHPKVLADLDVKGPLVGFELILDAIPPAKAKPTKAKPKLDLPDLMAVERDFAFIVDMSVKAGDILRVAQAADRALITSAQVFDVYEGTGVPEGKKSVGVSVTLQPRDKTLTDAEIEAVAAKIVGDVSKKTGATLRG